MRYDVPALDPARLVHVLERWRHLHTGRIADCCIRHHLRGDRGVLPTGHERGEEQLLVAPGVGADIRGHLEIGMETTRARPRHVSDVPIRRICRICRIRHNPPDTARHVDMSVGSHRLVEMDWAPLL